MLNEIYNEMAEKSRLEFPERKIVFGEGKENAEIMLIGEAPGGEEEKQGRPFVGSAGKNLNGFLEILDLKREEIFLSNVVKLRPFKLSPKTGKPVNRPPDRSELDFFTPYLLKEIKEVSPLIAVTLGNTALRAVLEDKKAVIGDYHGRITDKNGIKIFALYHPASIIYNQSLKEVYNEDLIKLGKILTSEIPLRNS